MVMPHYDAVVDLPGLEEHASVDERRVELWEWTGGENAGIVVAAMVAFVVARDPFRQP